MAKVIWQMSYHAIPQRVIDATLGKIARAVCQSLVDSLGVVDSMDEFIELRRTELAGRTAVLLRTLAIELDIEDIARQLHRIAGTSGSYDLMDGSRGAADLLARVRDEQLDGLANKLNALAEIFARSATGLES